MAFVQITDDFDLHKIACSGQCFRPREITPGEWLFVCGGHALLIRKAPTANAFEVSCTENEWQQIWRPYFDLGRSYAQVRANAAGQVPFLDSAMQAGAGLRILKQNEWEMLVSFIISQRKSIPAIRTSVEALCTNFGQEIPAPAFDGEGAPAPAAPAAPAPASAAATPDAAFATLHAFPTPQEILQADDAALASCGLGYRLPYVRSAAEMVSSGELDLAACHNLTDEQLFEELQRIHGVGKKVANCVCLFAYSRTSMVPIDVWIQRVIDEECGGQNPFPQFGPHAGILQQYAFYYSAVLSERRNS